MKFLTLKARFWEHQSTSKYARLKVRPEIENLTNFKSFDYPDDSIVKNTEVIRDRYHVKEK